MLLRCFYHPFEECRVVYEIEGPKGPKRQASSVENADAAAARRSRIEGLEGFKALGLLEEGQEAELAGLREAERATAEARQAAAEAGRDAETVLRRREAELPGGRVPGGRVPGESVPGEKPEKPAPASEEEDSEEGFEVVQEGEAADVLRRDVERAVYFYRGSPDASFNDLLDFLAGEYSVPRDKLETSGINRKSTDRAVADAVVKLAAAGDAGAQG